MRKRKLTKSKLLVELRRLLITPDTKIVKRKLHDHLGNSTWTEETSHEGKIIVSNIKISLDPRRDGSLTLVIHELLHIYMSVYHRISSIFNTDLEESAIQAWETDLMNYLQAPQREKKLESWNRAIQRKIIL